MDNLSATCNSSRNSGEALQDTVSTYGMILVGFYKVKNVYILSP